jgi:hypothetical protein
LAGGLAEQAILLSVGESRANSFASAPAAAVSEKGKAFQAVDASVRSGDDANINVGHVPSSGAIAFVDAIAQMLEIDVLSTRCFTLIA